MYNLIDTILNLVRPDVYIYIFFFQNKENNEQPAC